MIAILLISSVFIIFSGLFMFFWDEIKPEPDSLIYCFLDIFNPVIFAKSAIVLVIAGSWQLFTIFAK